MGLENIQENRNWRRLISFWTIAGLVMVVGVIILLYFLLRPSLQSLVDKGDAFLGAIENTEFDAAYLLLAPALKEAVSQSEFNDSLTGLDIESWTYDRQAVENEIGYLEGHLTAANSEFSFTLQLTYENDEWQIFRYDIIEMP